MKAKSNKLAAIEADWSALGYRAETLPLLLLAPPVQVAWAEGFVQTGERRTILRLAADLRIAPGSPGYAELCDWLEHRPPDEFFARATALLRRWLETMPAARRTKLRNVLLLGCVEVAQASSSIGLLRDRRGVNREEREQLAAIGEKLGFTPGFAA